MGSKYAGHPDYILNPKTNRWVKKAGSIGQKLLSESVSNAQPRDQPRDQPRAQPRAQPRFQPRAQPLDQPDDLIGDQLSISDVRQLMNKLKAIKDK